MQVSLVNEVLLCGINLNTWAVNQSHLWLNMMSVHKDSLAFNKATAMVYAMCRFAVYWWIKITLQLGYSQKARWEIGAKRSAFCKEKKKISQPDKRSLKKANTGPLKVGRAIVSLIASSSSTAKSVYELSARYNRALCVELTLAIVSTLCCVILFTMAAIFKIWVYNDAPCRQFIAWSKRVKRFK